MKRRIQPPRNWQATTLSPRIQLQRLRRGPPRWGVSRWNRNVPTHSGIQISLGKFALVLYT